MLYRVVLVIQGLLLTDFLKLVIDLKLLEYENHHWLFIVMLRNLIDGVPFIHTFLSEIAFNNSFHFILILLELRDSHFECVHRNLNYSPRNLSFKFVLLQKSEFRVSLIMHIYIYLSQVEVWELKHKNEALKLFLKICVLIISIKSLCYA